MWTGFDSSGVGDWQARPLSKLPARLSAGGGDSGDARRAAFSAKLSNTRIRAGLCAAATARSAATISRGTQPLLSVGRTNLRRQIPARLRLGASRLGFG